MSIFKPFKALRPFEKYATAIATKPYDVVSRLEVMEEAKKNPLTFFKVTRSELEFDLNENAYTEKVYAKAKTNLQQLIDDKIVFQEAIPCYYIYSLTIDGRTQTGLVGLSSVADYNNDLVKKHELTRPDKEQDRIHHIATTNAQTGNVFLAYRNNKNIDAIIQTWQKNHQAIYDLITEDKVSHKIWVVDNLATISELEALFLNQVPHTYIADGHHRAASAAKVHFQKKSEASKFFLTTLFPENQLKIMDYNRVVKDLNGHNEATFLEAIAKKFSITKSNDIAIPKHAREFGMYMNKNWYCLEAKDSLYENQNTIDALNVSILQQHLLHPILNIDDPRTSQRIDFVGGIRGWQELVKKVDSKAFAVAFMIYPISMEDLFAVADKGQIMPPKSTWFEPKLRDGLLTNLID